MQESVTAGLWWVAIDIIGVLVLLGALIYATWQWRKRRKTLTPGSVERAPGPAPEGAKSYPHEPRAV